MRGSSLKVAEYPANRNNYTIGRQGSTIKEITIHHMAGRLTARACASIFQNPNRKASSHYGIGYNGEIAQYVDENNTAWTNSNWESNKRAVTIETANSKNGEPWEVSDASINSLIKLVADIAKRNNLGTLVKGKNLTWHSMYANTNCPGEYLFSKFDYIINEANKLINEVQNIVNQGAGKPTPNPEPQPVPQFDLLLEVKKVIRGDYGNGHENRKRQMGVSDEIYEEVRRQVNANLNAGLTRWDNIRLF